MSVAPWLVLLGLIACAKGDGFPRAECEPGDCESGVVDTDGRWDSADTGVPVGWDTSSAPVLEGHLVVEDVEDLDGFCDHFRIIRGDLIVQGSTSTLEPLSCLEEIEGDLVLRAPALVDASLPKLTAVERIAVETETIALTQLDLPEVLAADGLEIVQTLSLERVSVPKVTELTDYQAGLRVESNLALTTLQAPRLERVVGKTTVRLNQSLVDLDLPALEASGYTQILENSSLESVTLPRLTLGNFHAEDNQSLTELSLGPLAYGRVELRTLPALTTLTVDPDAVLISFIAEDIGLVEVELESDHVDYLVLNGCPNLQRVNLTGEMTVAGAYTITFNPALEEVRVPNGDNATPSSVTGKLTWLFIHVPELHTIASNLKADGFRVFMLNAGVSNLDWLHAQHLDSMEVFECANLVDIEALNTVTKVDGEFTWMDNPSLQTSDIADMIESIGPSNIGGPITVGGNGP